MEPRRPAFHRSSECSEALRSYRLKHWQVPLAPHRGSSRLARERRTASAPTPDRSVRLSRLKGRRIEIADRRNDGRPRLKRVGQFCVYVRIPRVEERDIDRDRSGMKSRQRPHETSHHFARRHAASRFAERLIVNRDDDDARWRGTRAGKKEAPVEGQVFYSVQRRSKAVHLLRAQSSADEEGRNQKGAGQE